MDASQARTVDQLRAVLHRGGRAKYLLFWGHTAKGQAVGPWCLSQWYHAQFKVDGVRYPTAEHFMMASKARLFGDLDAEKAVLASKSPGEAKAIGRKVKGFKQEQWDLNRFKIVVTASQAKFQQNEKLGSYLASSKKRVLVEASPKDRVWGIGLAAESEHATNPHQWKGLNLLGFALMQARSTL